MTPRILYVPTVSLSTDWQQHIGTYEKHAKDLAKQAKEGKKTSYLQFDTIRAIFIATKEKVTILISETAYAGIITKPRDGAIESTTYSRYDGETANTASYIATTLGTSGGWEEGITKKENNVAIFPMTEASKLNFLLSGETDITEGNFVSECEYGNLYWTADVNDEVFTLSWKGTPTRHFPLDCYTNIPNFSTYLGVHIKQVGEVARFSAFDKYIYINCSKVESPPFTFPFYSPSENMASTANTSLASCIVLGASIDPITSTILIVCLSEFFNGSTGIATLSDGRLLKLDEALTEVSKNRSLTITNRLAAPSLDSRWITYWSYGGPYNGWSFVGQTDVPDDELYPDYAWSTYEYPWFADELGTTFTSSKGAKTQFVYDEDSAAYSINKLKDKDVIADDKLNEKVTYALVGTANEPYTDGEGELDIYSGQGVSLQVDYATSGSYDLFFEPIGNSSVSYSFSATTDETTLRGVSRIYGPMLRVKATQPEQLTITGSLELKVGELYYVGGINGMYSISAPDTAFEAITPNNDTVQGATFRVVSTTACGVVTISAYTSCNRRYDNAEDNADARLLVRGPLGGWYTVPNVQPPAFTLTMGMDEIKDDPFDPRYKYRRYDTSTNDTPTITDLEFWLGFYGKWRQGNRYSIQAPFNIYQWIHWIVGSGDIQPDWKCFSADGNTGYTKGSFVNSCSGYPAVEGCKISDGVLRYFDGGLWATIPPCPNQWNLNTSGGTYTGKRAIVIVQEYRCI